MACPVGCLPLSMILSENRLPPWIKSGGGFSGSCSGAYLAIRTAFIKPLGQAEAATTVTEKPPGPSALPVGQSRAKRALPGFALVERNDGGRPIRKSDRDIQPRERPQRLRVVARIILVGRETEQEYTWSTPD